MTVRKVDKICGKTDKNWKESIYKIMHFYTDQRRADEKEKTFEMRRKHLISGAFFRKGAHISFFFLSGRPI